MAERNEMMVWVLKTYSEATEHERTVLPWQEESDERDAGD